MLAKKWAGIVSRETVTRQRVMAVHSHRRAWEPIKTQNGAAHYVMKYATKTYQKDVPKKYQNVGRFWGASRDTKPVVALVMEADDDGVRHYLNGIKNPVGQWDVIPKFIFDRRNNETY